MEEITPEYSQLDLVREQASWRGVIIILWSLIFAKSFCLQWLALKYTIPINMLLYVWTPTYIFAGLGTWIYASYRKDAVLELSLESIVMRNVWQVAFVVMGILTVMGWGLKKFDAFLLPGMFALVLGIVYYSYYSLQRKLLQLICTLGWLCGGAGLLYYNEAGAVGLFSVMIIFFQVLPCIVLYWCGKKSTA